MGYEDIANRIEERDKSYAKRAGAARIKRVAVRCTIALLILIAMLFVGSFISLLDEEDRGGVIVLAIIGFFVVILVLCVMLSNQGRLDITLDKHDFDLVWLNELYKPSLEKTPAFLHDDRETFWRATNPYDPDFKLETLRELTSRVTSSFLTENMWYFTGWRGVKGFYLLPSKEAPPVYGPCLVLRILYDILNDDSVQAVGIKNVMPLWAFTSDREFGFELCIRWNNDMEIFFLVKATHLTNQVTVSTGHHILWHQPWMRFYPRTPAGEIGLASQYRELSRMIPEKSEPPNSLASAHKEFREGRGRGWIISKTNSFLHFSVQDHACGQGTQVGAFISKLGVIVNRACALTCEGDDGWEDKNFQVEAPDQWK